MHVLPAVTEQQRLLHEVIWVEGCERWIVSAASRRRTRAGSGRV